MTVTSQPNGWAVSPALPQTKLSGGSYIVTSPSGTPADTYIEIRGYTGTPPALGASAPSTGNVTGSGYQGPYSGAQSYVYSWAGTGTVDYWVLLGGLLGQPATVQAVFAPVRLGVLKVNVGTGLAPDWRKVGCGGGGGFTGPLADTFNRADSTTTVNPASDGGTWQVDAGVWGISGNRAVYIGGSDTTAQLRQFTGGGTGYRTISTPTATANADVSVRNYTTIADSVPESVLMISGSAAPSGPMLHLVFDGFPRGFAPFFGGTPGRVYYHQGNGNARVLLAEIVLTSWSGLSGGTLLRCTYNATTGVINVYQNGTLKGTATADVSQRLTAGWVGLGGQSPYTSNALYWDDFSAVGVSTTYGGVATTGRLKLWDGTQWLREACDDGVSDDFNRADSSSSVGGTGWVVRAVPNGGVAPTTYAWGISGNKAYVVSNSGGTGAYAGSYRPIMALRQTTSPDFDMSFDVPDTFGSGGFNKTLAAYRVDADGSGYFFGTMTLSYINALAETFTGLAGNGTDTVFDPGDTIRVVVVGTSHKIYRNGVLLWDVTDGTDVTSVDHGLAGLGPGLAPTMRWDNFSIAAPSHPLKLWDGSAWQTVACMTPA